MSIKSQVSVDPTLVIFLQMKKNSIEKKLQVWDKSGALIQHFFFESEISKKITSVGSSAFQKKNHKRHL